MLSNKPPQALSRRKRLAFAALVLLLLYALLEVASLCAFRLNYGRWYTWSSSAADRDRAAKAVTPEYVPEFSFGVVHPYVGYVVQPGWNPDNPDALYPFLWTEEFTNQPFDGFPSRRPVLQRKAPDTTIVGIFGGSVAEVYYHQGVHLTLRKLHEHPDYRGRKFVVVCPASGGYKQPQQLMALNYILAQGGQFDIIINIDGFNEVALHAPENEKHGVYPIYPRSWFSRVGQIREPGILKLYGRAALLETEIRDTAGFFSHRPLSCSPACHLLWRARSRSLEKRLRETMSAIEDSGFEIPFVRTGPDYRPASGDDLYRDLVQIWESSSRQMRALCEANDIRYFHFLQPNQYVSGSKPLDKAEMKTAFRENHPYRAGVERGYPLLREAGERLRAAGENYTDLTEIFASTPEPVYTDDCCHFGERGNEIMAGRIAETILRGH